MVGQVLIFTVAYSPLGEAGGRLLLKVTFSGGAGRGSQPGEAGVPHLCTGVSETFLMCSPLYLLYSPLVIVGRVDG